MQHSYITAKQCLLKTNRFLLLLLYIIFLPLNIEDDVSGVNVYKSINQNIVGASTSIS